MIRALLLSRPYRIAFAIDALLAVGAALYWMLASGAFVHSVFGVASPDAAHMLLAQKGAIPLLFGHGLYGLALLRGREVPAGAFRTFHALLLGSDAAFAVLGWQMLALATAPGARAAAVAQIAVALLRAALRGTFLLTRSRPG